MTMQDTTLQNQKIREKALKYSRNTSVLEINALSPTSLNYL
jgi:hypothetical protein